jgi:hypothetical protein
MTTKRNWQTFEATVNGRNYEFDAYTTSTRCGFCHTVQTWCNYRNIATDTKRSYYNRTWERFDYETALAAAIEKCPKEDRTELRAILIERKAKDEHDKAEAFIGAFSRVWSQVSDANKERIASAAGTIETPEQAQAVMSAARMAVALQAIE